MYRAYQVMENSCKTTRQSGEPPISRHFRCFGKNIVEILSRTESSGPRSKGCN